MLPPKAIDQDRPLIVGKKYLVECVRSRPYDSDEILWLPIFGTIHIDEPFLLETNPHIHIDMRFLKRRELDIMGLKPSDTGGLMMPGLKENSHKLNLATRTPKGYAIPTEWQIRKCKRQWISPPVPFNCLRAEFESKYCNHVIKKERPICPHQGFDLSTVEPTIINGKEVIVCPGHRLGWCNKTGRLVPSK